MGGLENAKARLNFLFLGCQIVSKCLPVTWSSDVSVGDEIPASVLYVDFVIRESSKSTDDVTFSLIKKTSYP